MPRQFRTGGQTLVREFNRSIILNQLRTGSPLSRADLAAITGLNKTTVSSLVDELLQHRLLREIGPNASAGGRPAVLLELNAAAGSIVGVEIGVGYLSVVLTDFRASIYWRRQVPFYESDTPRHVITRLITLLGQAVRQVERLGTRLYGIGIAIPGLVDVAEGRVFFGPNLKWRDVPLRELLRARFDLPIFVDNDANAAALGERYFGAAQRADNFVYVVANVGLGIGIVVGGHIFQGASGYAGEAGHMTIDPTGPLCRCGNRGCWERLASQRALVERVEKAVHDGQLTSIVSTGNGSEPISISMIVQAARDGDQVSRRALEETGVYLGIGIANLINIFNPSLVAFGGALSVADEFLTPVIRQTLSERAISGPRQAVQFVVSQVKSDACVMGGVALVLHDILSRPRIDFPRTDAPAGRPINLRKEVIC